MVKRKWSVFVCIVLVFALIASACTNNSKNNDSNNKSNNNNVDSEEITFPITSGETLKVVSQQGIPQQVWEEGLPVLDEMYEHTGVKVEWDLLPAADWKEIIQTRLNAGADLPDIIKIPGDPVQYANDGTIIPITDMLDEYAPNLKAWIEKDPTIQQTLTFPDGEIYLLPAAMIEGGGEAADKYNGLTLLIRKDWLKKLGLEEPQTREDLYNVLKAFKTDDPNGNGEADEIPMSAPPWAFNMIGAIPGWSHGLHFYNGKGWHVNEDGTVVYEYASEELLPWLETMQKWYADGLIDPEFTSLTEENFMSQLVNGQVGVIPLLVSWAELTVNPPIREATGDPDAGFYPILPLIGDDGERMVESHNKSVPAAVGGLHFAITSNSKNPELALKYWDYISYSEQGALWNQFGVDGLSYEMVDGKPVIKEEIYNDPEGLTVALSRIGAFRWPVSQVATEEGMAVSFAGTSRVHEIGEEILQYRDPHFIVGPPTKDESETMATMMTDIETFIEESISGFIKGNKSLDEFDSYLKTLESMGIQEIIDIKQAQYDRVQ